MTFALAAVFATAANAQGACAIGGEPVLKLEKDKIEWKVVNTGTATVMLDSVTLTWPAAHGELEKIKFDGHTIYEQPVPAPTATIDSGWDDDPEDRQIEAGDTVKVKFEFDEDVDDTALTDYKITLNFAEGCSVSFDVTDITECSVGGAPTIKVDDDKIEWELFNFGTADIVLRDVALSWPAENGNLEKIELKGKIFDEDRAPPETFVDTWESDDNKRTIKADKDEKLKFKFDEKYDEAMPLDYGIQVVFETGCMAHFNMPFDEVPPVVTLFDPADGNIDDVLADLVFEIVDEPAGVDPATIAVAVNGVLLDGSRFSFDGSFLTVLADTNAPWAPGNLQLYVDVADRAGNGTRYTFDLRVLPGTTAIPVAVPTSGDAPLRVTFFPQSTADTAISLYEWDFQGDGTFDVAETVGRTQTFTYTVPGDYNATLRVTDQTGVQDVSSVLIQVGNAPPVVTAEAVPSNGAVPLAVSFTASATDNEGIATYEWDFEGDGTFDTSASTGGANFTYTTQGTFQPAVRVTDTLGASTTLTVPSIEVRVNPPGSPSVTASASPASGAVPLNVSFDASATDPDGLGFSNYAWDFDNDGVFDAQGPNSAVSFTYTSPGIFFARVEVTATDGGMAEDFVQVTVEPDVSLSVSADTIDPMLMETSNVQTVLGGDTDITIQIEDRVGNVVRTLVPSGVRPAGTYDDAWDGTDDDGNVVIEGDYYAVALFVVDGETQRLDLRTTTGGAQYLPSRSSIPNSFSPFAGDPLDITFTLPVASEVTAFMGRFNVNVRLVTFLQRAPRGRGSYTLVWNGENADGQLIHPPPGDRFLFGLFGYRLADNAIYVRSGAQISALQASPSIFSPGSVADDGGRQMSTLSFDLSNDADVELAVYDADSGDLIAELDYAGLVAGPQSLEWDGKTDAGIFVAPGRYRLGLTAVDGNGFRSTTVYVLQRIYY